MGSTNLSYPKNILAKSKLFSVGDLIQHYTDCKDTEGGWVSYGSLGVIMKVYDDGPTNAVKVYWFDKKVITLIDCIYIRRVRKR